MNLRAIIFLAWIEGHEPRTGLCAGRALIVRRDGVVRVLREVDSVFGKHPACHRRNQARTERGQLEERPRPEPEPRSTYPQIYRNILALLTATTSRIRLVSTVLAFLGCVVMRTSTQAFHANN